VCKSKGREREKERKKESEGYSRLIGPPLDRAADIGLVLSYM